MCSARPDAGPVMRAARPKSGANVWPDRAGGAPSRSAGRGDGGTTGRQPLVPLADSTPPTLPNRMRPRPGPRLSPSWRGPIHGDDRRQERIPAPLELGSVEQRPTETMRRGEAAPAEAGEADAAGRHGPGRRSDRPSRSGGARRSHDPSEGTVSAPSQRAATARRAPGKKPTKFLADLTKAMQAAAEAAREQTLTPVPGRREDVRRADPRPLRDRGRRPRRRPTTTRRRSASGRRPRSPGSARRPRRRSRPARLGSRAGRGARGDDRAPDRAGPGPRRRLRARDGGVLRGPPGRGGSDPLRDDGRDACRSRRVRGHPAEAFAAVEAAVAETADETDRPSRRGRGPVAETAVRDRRAESDEADADEARPSRRRPTGRDRRRRDPSRPRGRSATSSPRRARSTATPCMAALEAAAEATVEPPRWPPTPPARPRSAPTSRETAAELARPQGRRCRRDPASRRSADGRLRRRRGRGRRRPPTRSATPKTSPRSTTTPSPTASRASCPAHGRRKGRRRRDPSTQVVVVGLVSRRQHRQLQAPSRPAARRPVGRRLVRPRRRVRVHGQPPRGRHPPGRDPDAAGLRGPRHRLRRRRGQRDRPRPRGRGN